VAVKYREQMRMGPFYLAFPFLTVQVCIGIMVMLVLYNYWFLYIPYLVWFYYDWRTPEQGGRRWNWVQSWPVWKYFKEYFPICVSRTVF
jgi:2-acylglycerol O-acyltransferase 1